MKPIYVYVESTQSLAFQFIPFGTLEQANRFVISLKKRSKTLRSYVVDL